MRRNKLTRQSSIGLRGIFLVGLIGLAASHSPALAKSHVFLTMAELDLPVVQGAREPSLFAMGDGRILMSWTEPAGKGFAVKTAVRDHGAWSQPRTAVLSDSLFVNWADFPAVTAFSDGTLAIHWLTETGNTAYSYDVNIALSPDEGLSWGKVLVPHRDRTRDQHGFVSLLPVKENRILAVWLDARAYDTGLSGAEYGAFTNAMQLRTATVGLDGSLSEDTLLDVRTCTCCQTSAAVTESGIVLVAYRDRSAEEIRDISLIRQVDGVWSEPSTVHADGWEISGCPVNGPAIDTAGERAVVAWFTAANNIPAVNVAFSQDAGESFGRAFRIDRGDGVGRVDVLHLEDGSAVVSWVEWTEKGEVLNACRALAVSGCSEPQLITLNEAPGSINFPRMVQGRDGIYIAWTQPLSGSSADPERDVTIRMVLATP